jgi:hypothetical protein
MKLGQKKIKPLTAHAKKLLKRQADILDAVQKYGSVYEAYLARLNEKTIARRKPLSKKQIQEIAKAVGIWTEDGKLTRSYGGE